MVQTSENDVDNSIGEFLNQWQATGRQKLTELGLVALIALPNPTASIANSKKQAALATKGDSGTKTADQKTSPAKIKYRVEILDDDTLPTDMDVASGLELFLATLGGKSKETVRTYRTGCRRFLTFLYSTGRGEPTTIQVSKLPVSILERYYDWLVINYTGDNAGSDRQKSTNTVSGYMAAARNLFEYLASRNISPGGVQYQRLVARLPKLQARSGGYRTPRALRTRQNRGAIEQLARLAVATPLQAQVAGAEVSSLENASLEAANPEELIDVAPKTRRKRSQQIHNPAEIERQKQEAARNRAIILTLYTTGMRRHEIAGLNRPELETLLTIWQKDKAKIALQAAESATSPAAQPPVTNTQSKPVYELIIRGKGSKERFVYFDEVTLGAIEEYLTLRGQDNCRPLFLQHHRGRDARPGGEKGENWRIGTGTVWEIAVDFGREKLGITIRPHDFRHNLATVLLNAGAKLEEVQDLLGHSSPATTKMIYAHYSQQHLKDVFSRFRNPANPE